MFLRIIEKTFLSFSEGKKSPSSPKKTGRPPAGVKNKTNSAVDTTSSVVAAVEKQPAAGDVSFPLTCWSLTITRTGMDIHTSLLDNMNQFLQNVCTREFFHYDNNSTKLHLIIYRSNQHWSASYNDSLLHIMTPRR